VRRWDVLNAYSTSEKALEALLDLHDHLAWSGVRLARSCFPGRPAIVANYLVTAPEDFFKLERDYLEIHGGEVFEAELGYLGIEMELMEEIRKAMGVIESEQETILDLMDDVGFLGTFIPRFIPLRKARPEGMRVLDKWKDRKLVGDCVELREIVERAERLRLEVNRTAKRKEKEMHSRLEF
jgi:hypothetical protein